MRSISSASSLLLLVLFVAGFAADKAVAQAPIASSDEKTYTDKVPSVQKGNRSFTVEPSYVLKEMTAGHEVKFTITITAPSSGPNFLELRNQPIMTSQDAADKFHFQNNGVEDSEGVVHSRKYHFIVRINDDVEPRRHQVAVGFALPGEPEVSSRYFDLYVGVNSNGKLAVVPPAEDSQPPSFETEFFTGQKHTYDLKLQNSFPDYTVYIESIKIQSDPAGLIAPQEFTYENNIPLTPSEVKTISLPFTASSLSVKNLIKGIGTTPRIQAEVVYNDGNERRITDFKPREAIIISPTGWTLVGAVILGLVIGAAIRVVLELVLSKKKKKRLIRAASYSFIFGIILVVLVALGQIEIKTKTFALSSSYDNPLTMLILGMIGALLGLQMIIAWYQSFKTD